MEAWHENGNLLIHQNGNYNVVVGEEEYYLHNRATGLVEAHSKSLPEIITLAEQANAFLVNRIWRWYSSQAEKQGDALDEENIEIEFEEDFDFAGNELDDEDD